MALNYIPYSDSAAHGQVISGKDPANRSSLWLQHLSPLDSELLQAFKFFHLKLKVDSKIQHYSVLLSRLILLIKPITQRFS